MDDDEKKQVERIRRAAVIIAEHLTGGHEQRMASAVTIAKQALEVADKEPPDWPSYEGVRRFRAAFRSSTNTEVMMGDEWLRDCLREVMVNDDIIQAAVELRDASNTKVARHAAMNTATYRIIKAVDEAGL